MIIKKTFFYFTLFMIIFGAPLAAQDTGAAAGNTVQKTTDETKLSVETTTPAANGQVPPLNQNLSAFSVWDVVRMVLVLGGVLGVIYLLFYLLKRMGRQVKDAGDTIQIIATKNISSNSTLHLVKIGGQIFFVGAGDGSVRLLSEITDSETLDQLKLEQSALHASNRSFSDVIRGALKGGGVLKKAGREENSFLKQQKDRLKNM